MDGLVISQQQGFTFASGSTKSGSLKLEADCLGRLREVDGLGGVYNYRVVLLASEAGYLYIQSDPADLTVGYLAHQRP